MAECLCLDVVSLENIEAFIESRLVKHGKCCRTWKKSKKGRKLKLILRKIVYLDVDLVSMA